MSRAHVHTQSKFETNDTVFFRDLLAVELIQNRLRSDGVLFPLPQPLSDLSEAFHLGRSLQRLDAPLVLFPQPLVSRLLGTAAIGGGKQGAKEEEEE